MNPNDPAYDYGGRARDDEARAAEQAEHDAHHHQMQREHHAHQAIEFAVETLGFDTVVMAAIGHQIASTHAQWVRKGVREALSFAEANRVDNVADSTVDYLVARALGTPTTTPDEPF